MTPPSKSALHLVRDSFCDDDSREGSASDESVHPTTDVAALDPTHSRPLPTPLELRRRHGLSHVARSRISEARRAIKARIEQGVGAPLAIVGPCSIHCETAALEYAERLLALQQRLGARVQIVMRVYFEKPRTTVGWKGFLYDPDVDGSDDLEKGVDRARALMVKIAELGLPIATEILDPLAAQYLEDCVSWVAIGARTSESQIHRQLASGLGCAVGFKNGTDGSVAVAAQASESAAAAHTHLGVDDHGRVAMKRSAGNPATHVVLRGGKSGPNYDRESIAAVATTLVQMGRRAAVLVDCSHGNSEKDYARQPEVARAVMAQMGSGPADIVGLMLESHLVAGQQSADGHRVYGMSITDGCIDFATTEALLLEMTGASLQG